MFTCHPMSVYLCINIEYLAVGSFVVLSFDHPFLFTCSLNSLPKYWSFGFTSAISSSETFSSNMSRDMGTFSGHINDSFLIYSFNLKLSGSLLSRGF